MVLDQHVLAFARSIARAINLVGVRSTAVQMCVVAVARVWSVFGS